jgi:hypothetical protein
MRCDRIPGERASARDARAGEMERQTPDGDQPIRRVFFFLCYSPPFSPRPATVILQASFGPNEPSSINDCLTLLRCDAGAIGKKPENRTGDSARVR